jgi:hypothetical protein
MTAAGNLLRPREEAEVYAPVPFFWSDQYDVTIQYGGHARGDDEVRVVAGSVEERKFVALYGRGGRVLAVLGFNNARAVSQYRRKIAAGLTWAAALAEA